MDPGVETDSGEVDEEEEGFVGVSETPEADFMCCHSTSSGELDGSTTVDYSTWGSIGIAVWLQHFTICVHISETSKVTVFM